MKRIAWVCALVLGALQAGAQAPAGPWSLEACIQYAIGHNGQVKQSELNLEASKALQVQSRLAMLPTARAGASHALNAGRSINPFTYEFIEEQFQSNDLGLNGGLNLFSGLQQQHLVKANVLQVKASQQELGQSLNLVSLQVALAYLAVLQNQELLEVTRRQVAVSRSQLERAGKLAAAGNMALATLADLKVQAGNDELEQVNAASNLQTAKLALMQLMNLPASGSFEVEARPIDLPQAGAYEKEAAEVYALAEKNQPAIVGADLRVRSSQRAVQAARGGLFPSLSLFGYIGSGYSSAFPPRFVGDGTFTTRETVSETDYILVNNSRQYLTHVERVANGREEDFQYVDQLKYNLRKSVGISLSLPILNGWQVRNQISNAVLARKKAELEASNARMELRQQIELAWSQLSAAQTRLQVCRAQAEATAQAYLAAQKRFESGSVHFVDLNLAKTNDDRAQSNLVRAKYDYVFRKKVLDFYQDKPLTLQ
ncbi:MAG: TolC family protein [Adhaeribacter sp.]